MNWFFYQQGHPHHLHHMQRNKKGIVSAFAQTKVRRLEFVIFHIQCSHFFCSILFKYLFNIIKDVKMVEKTTCVMPLYSLMDKLWYMGCEAVPLGSAGWVGPWGG